MNANLLSEQLLLATKSGKPFFREMVQLELMPLQELKSSLNTDQFKLAFWINIYNAYFLILRKEMKLEKPSIFFKREIKVAGLSLSLDDIEHVILRRNRLKWSFGYLPNPFSSLSMRRLMVAKREYRVHFALNCGVKSCPPIATYTPEKIERQLEMATQSFLESETIVLDAQKKISTSRLLWWYQGDFGGKTGIRRMLESTLHLQLQEYILTFSDYDWTEQLNNFHTSEYFA
ncbi:MAG: DUF547 domain-containing protein [Saprospiraceae bacterium]|nr:DUF547 domain-containing protein [Saprospiraceae bacterium]